MGSEQSSRRYTEAEMKLKIEIEKQKVNTKWQRKYEEDKNNTEQVARETVRKEIEKLQRNLQPSSSNISDSSEQPRTATYQFGEPIKPNICQNFKSDQDQSHFPKPSNIQTIESSAQPSISGTLPMFSTSGERSYSRISDSNQDVLKCPKCLRQFSKIIFQCPKGHSCCNDCKNTEKSCRECGMPVTIRNRSLEEFVANLKVSCPYSEDGCKLLLRKYTLQAHINECPFKELKCPIDGVFGMCQWSGKLQQLMPHFDNVHPMHRNGRIDTEMSLFDLKSDHHIVYLVRLGSFHFLFHLKISQTNEIYFIVQLIGTEMSAKKWMYEIHIYNKNEPRRKFVYTEICRSNQTPLQDIINEKKCAVINFTHASTYVSNGRFLYKFFIKKDIDSKKVPKIE